MNLRNDNITDIPLGFNYKISEDYKPPVFDQEIYDEDVNKNPYEGLEPPKVEVDDENLQEKPEVEPEGEGQQEGEDQTEDDSENIEAEVVAVDSYSGSRLDALITYLQNNNLQYEIVSEVEKVVKEGEENLVGLSFVIDNSVGDFTSKDLINISTVKYVNDNSEKKDQ